MHAKHSKGAVGAVAAALVAFAALTPVGAGAHAIHGPRFRSGGPHQITIHAQPDPIVAGDPVVIDGRLVGRNDENRLVVLYHHAEGSGGGFVPVQSTRTGVGGAYEFSRADGRVDSNRDWYVVAADAVSRVVRERVAGLVTLAVTGPNGQSEPDGAVLTTGRGNAYTFAGNDSPGLPGARVLLQRQSANGGPDNWVTIGRGTLDASGNYSIAHNFVIPSSSGGDANVRVFVPADVRNIGSPSESLSYEIEQQQNPALTIVPASYVILEGSSDTITGVDAQGVGKMLTLYAHTAHQPWAVVATSFTVSGGAYSFSIDPISNTYYRVDAGRGPAISASGSTGTSGPTGTTGSTAATGSSGSDGPNRPVSAVAFVGVRALLSVQTTPLTINQGQSVTFTGSLTPDETGRNILLERLNASGDEWHIIASAVVGADSQYSITNPFYEVGTETVRVAIAGSPVNQGNATPPMTVTVNAIPATALVPAGG
jgi:hypothetical protein